jgi:hypothetical protein
MGLKILPPAEGFYPEKIKMGRYLRRKDLGKKFHLKKIG